MPAFLFVSIHHTPLPTAGIHTNAAYFSFIDPEAMKG